MFSSLSGGERDPLYCLFEGPSSVPSWWDFGRRRWICVGCHRWQPFPGERAPDHWSIIWRRRWAGGGARGRGGVASWSGEHGEVQSWETETLQSEESKNNREVFSQIGVEPDRCMVRQTGLTVFLSSGWQSEESVFQAEHREEDDEDWNKDCFSGATREDQTENLQPEGFTSDLQHQEGTEISVIIILHESDYYHAF